MHAQSFGTSALVLSAEGTKQAIYHAAEQQAIK
jgi:hypothetical protein